MSSKSWLISLPAGLLALGFAVLYGQQSKTGSQPKTGTPTRDTGTIFRVDTHPVFLNTTVVDKNKHLVTNLKQEAFTVYENDVRQEITSFLREDVPVSMGLIIDNSGSMRAKRASVEAAAKVLIKESNPDDEVFVVNFNDDAFIDNPHGKDFLTDFKDMEEALTRIDSRGGTAMREAIDKSINWLKKAHKTKKVLVVVTDGVDNASEVSLEDLVRRARQSEVLIYPVGLLWEELKRDSRTATRQLNALAEATGGDVFYPNELSQVDSVAHQVARDIRSQYTIGYRPSNEALDGTFRRVRVTVKAPGNPTPRTRTGYYATPEGVAAQAAAPAPTGK